VKLQLTIGSLGGRLGRHDADRAAATAHAEFHLPGYQSEQRVVATAADTLAGVEVRAALTDQDLAGLDDLTAEPLDAQSLSV
jgi:hypothetical protein